jgi:hypothetical protein
MSRILRLGRGEGTNNSCKRRGDVLMIRFHLPLLLTIALGPLATPLAAQETRPAETPPPTSRPAEASEPATAEPRGLLAGPRVEPAARGDVAARRPGRDRAARASASPREWVAILRRMDLTLAQRSTIRGIVSDLDRRRRRHFREHGAEIRALRARLERTDRDTPPADAASAREARARLAALQQKAPRVAVYQQRIWDELTPEQRERLRAELRRLRRERAERRRRDEPGRRRPERP